MVTVLRTSLLLVGLVSAVQVSAAGDDAGSGGAPRPAARFGAPRVTDNATAIAEPNKLDNLSLAGNNGSPSSGTPVPPMQAMPAMPPDRENDGLFSRRRSTTVWGSAEFVWWWIRGGSLPPLLTASPAGTPQASAGVLGLPGTTILYGDGRVNGEVRAGGRFQLGSWLNEEAGYGIEAGLMLIGGRASTFSANSNGTQILTRPFTDAATDAQLTQLVSFPGVVGGSADIRASSDPLVIADVSWRQKACSSCGCSVDFLAGYRYMHFAEGLQIQENLTSLSPATLGANVRVYDSFSTQNEFHGGMVGVQAESVLGPLSWQVFGKLAIGNLHRQVTIDGSTVIAPPGGVPTAYPGGIYALPSNSGTVRSNQFVCLPELGFTGGWQVTSYLRLTAGYSFLWLVDVVRPGDQIDRTLNPNQFPPALPATPLRPLFSLHESDLWIQGIRIGAELRF